MEDKSPEFYKAFYEENKVSVLQYASLRKHFNQMVHDVLGGNYYNIAMDVYEADRICCEDIVANAGKKSLLHKIAAIFN
jgi:hypothetical protein